MVFLRTSALALALTCGSAAVLVARPANAQGYVGWTANYPPPPLPVYLQPPLPGPDYIWEPGYWAWDDDVEDYYWVPGVWVLAPEPGLLWTPGYWGWNDGAYLFHQGYWGGSVGWYGGVVYGFGYTGRGFAGGYWRGPHYFYNRSVNNVTNVHVTNVYNQTVNVRATVNNVSYNGGPGGVTAAPSAQQLAAERAPHFNATPLQAQHARAAQNNRLLYASANRGVPPIAAMPRPAAFSGADVMSAARSGAPIAARPTYGDPRGYPPAFQGYSRDGQAARPSPQSAPYVAPRAAQYRGEPPPAYATRPQGGAQNPYAGAGPRNAMDAPPSAAASRPPSSRPVAPRPAPPRPAAHPNDHHEDRR